ncbi:MAG: hypothetical protein NDI94_03595, partial [Candidatus Woesearchaeota archaeon]|nr:hypothetical protein [Candidatus Woesearchaeota archaeon]
YMTFISVVLVTFLLMFQRKDKNKLIALITLDLFILSIYAFNYPQIYQVDRDSGFETQYSELLMNNRFWDPRMGTGYAEDYYGYNPSIHFTMGFLSLVSDVSVHVIAKYFFLAFMKAAILILTFLIIGKIFSKKYHYLSYIAIFLYIITPRLRVLTISRRLLGVFFLLLALYSLMNIIEKKKQWHLIYLLSQIMIVISDHSMAMFYLIFMICGAMFYLCYNLALGLLQKSSYKENGLNKLFIKNAFIYLVIYIATDFALFSGKHTHTNLTYLKSIVTYIFDASNLISKPAGIAAVKSPFVYNLSESFAIYLSQALIVLVAGVIATYLIFELFKKSLSSQDYFSNPGFFIYFMTFCGIGYILTLALAMTKWTTFTNVFSWFPLIGISVLLAIFLASKRFFMLQGKAFFIAKIALVFLIYLGGLLTNYHPTVLYPRSDSKMVMEFMEYKNQRIYDSARWLQQNDPDATIIGDKSIFDIYGSYFNYDSALTEYSRIMYLSSKEDYEKKFLRWPVWVGSYEQTMRRQKLDYIITNDDVYHLPSYLMGEPLDPSYNAKFDSSNKTSKIYDDGKITIYHNKEGSR